VPSYFKRNNSPYYYVKLKHPQTGEWLSITTGERTRRLAEARYPEIVDRLRQPEAYLPNIPLADALGEWLAEREECIGKGFRRGRADSQATWDSRVRYVRRLLPVVAEYLAESTHPGSATEPRAADISADFVQFFIRRRLKDIKAVTLNKEISNLRVFAKWARGKSYLAEDPLAGVSISYVEVSAGRALTAEQATRLLEVCPEAKRANLEFRLETGCRPGEVEEVLWRHVTLDADPPRVHLPGRKTEKADRWVPIRASYAEKLRGLHPGPEGLDQPVVGKWTNIRRVLPRICRQIGIDPPIRPTDFRHTYATLALEAGVSDTLLAEVLGHESTAMIHKHYKHLRVKPLQVVADSLPRFTEDEEDEASREVEADSGSPYVHQEHAESPSYPAYSGTERQTPESANSLKLKREAVARDGIEPPTQGFSVPLRSAGSPHGCWLCESR